MDIILLLVVSAICIMVMAFVISWFYLFMPRYEHRNPLLGQDDIRISNRYERWKDHRKLRGSTFAPVCLCDTDRSHYCPAHTI